MTEGQTPRPIFILGAPRSGTSVLTWSIGQHPNIIPVPETTWISALASYVRSIYQAGVAAGEDGHIADWNVGQAAFLETFGEACDKLVRSSFDSFQPHRRGGDHEPPVGFALMNSACDPKRRWVDGTPASSGFALTLAAMFPEAQFVNILRRPEDFIRSWLLRSWRTEPMNDATIAHLYESYSSGIYAHSAMPERSIRVIYENIIRDPEGELKRIFEFLGEAYSPDSPKTYQTRINGSEYDQSKTDIEDEMATVMRSELFERMARWYEAAQDPDWRVERDPSRASATMAHQTNYKMSLPA